MGKWKGNAYSEHKIIHCKDTDETCTGDKYLSSKHWKGLRIRIYEKFGGECQRCKEIIPFNVANIHHRTYLRIGNEKETDLILYCDRCHKIIHRAKKQGRQTNGDFQDFCSKLTKREKAEALEVLKKHFDYIDF